MAIERYELEQRRMGNIVAADEAKRLRETHGDLPAIEVTPSGVEMPTEALRLAIESFRSETRIYHLSGEPFMEFWHFGYNDWNFQTLFMGADDFEEERSRKSWVAFTPYPFAHVDAQGKSQEELQAEIDGNLDKLNDELVKKELGDLKAVQGNLSDYAELAAQFRSRAGDFIGRTDDIHTGYILTSTKVGDSSAVIHADLQTWMMPLKDAEDSADNLRQVYKDGFKIDYILLPLIVPKKSL